MVKSSDYKVNAGFDNAAYLESESDTYAVIDVSVTNQPDRDFNVLTDSGETQTGDALPLSTCDKFVSQCRRVKDFFTGTDILVYSSHFLSAWGDRMWAFGVALFLIDIAPESLQLTASYGLASGITVLLLGVLIGDWVDNTPRLKAAQLSLVLQNLFVVLCAGVVFAHLTYRDQIVTIWDGWLEKLSFVVIIILAILSTLFSIARVIAVEKDWIVEICGKDKDMLAKMTATLRRIDLGTKILAPIATGQIMYFTQIRIGAIFIGGWNIVTVFFEYYLIWKVYNTVPALRKKKDWTKADRENARNENIEEVPVAESAEDTNQSHSGDDGLVMATRGDNSQGETTLNPSNEDEIEMQMSPNTIRNNEEENVEKETVVAQPRSCCGKCLKRMFSSVITLCTGWRTYMQYSVANAGLGLSCLYMTVLGFDNITTGFAYSQGISESILGVFQAGGALIGIIGTLLYPVLRRCVGLERTGLFALTAQIACLSLCIVSVWMPGSPFEWDYFMKDHPQANTSSLSLTTFTPDISTLTPDIVTLNSTGIVRLIEANTYVSDSVLTSLSPLGGNTTMSTPFNVTEGQVNEPVSYLSIGLLMAGIITARFGLWVADLTITQLFMEQVIESERGKVNGVQNSLNRLMDMLKFGLVVALPQPEVFGYLVFISFAFICLGFILYSSFSRRSRGHLLPFHKHCVTVTGEEVSQASAA